MLLLMMTMTSMMTSMGDNKDDYDDNDNMTIAMATIIHYVKMITVREKNSRMGQGERTPVLAA